MKLPDNFLNEVIDYSREKKVVFGYLPDTITINPPTRLCCSSLLLIKREPVPYLLMKKVEHVIVESTT